MARKKAGDNKITAKATGGTGALEPTPNVQADHSSIAIGGIHIGRDLSGSLSIGYTAEQVSFLLTQISTDYQRKPFDGRCPYKGLDVFEEEDADLFFGRERLVEDLVRRVKDSRTVFITGPSGSGKSSLVRAGLIHAMKHGAIRGSERWLYETMKPGREPLKELALAFSRLKSPELANYFQSHVGEVNILHECTESVLSGRKDQRFVLFLDQFEEVFTQVSREEERLAFISMLAQAATIENGRVTVLFAMRSDFLSSCAAYPALNELLSRQFRQVGAMQPEELVSAIARPALQVGLRIDPDLIAQIINDMEGEPGALPLMQFALKDLFDSQQEKGGVIALTLEDYLQHGGIHKSLERHADNSFARLGENEQELARSIFSRLIEVGRGTQYTRRTALFGELVQVYTEPKEVKAVVQKLADARLVITDEQAGRDTITISHEKLIDAWPWLKKLVNEYQDVIALQNEIADDAKEWEDQNRDQSYLYTGARLGNAREQLEAKKLALGGLAQQFIEAGVQAHADELDAAKQRATQLRKRSVYLSAALIVALLAVGVAVFFSFQSRQQAQIARAGELAAQSAALREKNFPVSLLLGIEAFDTLDTLRTRGNLLDLAKINPQLLQFLTAHSVSTVSSSPDGKVLASGSEDGTIILWDTRTYQQIGEPIRQSGSVRSIAFSQDGSKLAVSLYYPSTGEYGTIRIWAVDTRQQIGEIRPQTNVRQVAFSPDGTKLAVSLTDPSGVQIGTINIWDVETLKQVGKPLQVDESMGPFAFSPDGTILASGSGDNIILWNVDTHQKIGEPLQTPGPLLSLAYNPDNTRLVSSSYTLSEGINASTSSIIVFWDVDTYQQIDEPLQFAGYVSSVTFSRDGRTLAWVNNDDDIKTYNSTINLWDVDARQQIGDPLQVAGFLSNVTFSRDGRKLASSSDIDNGTIILWAVDKQQQVGEPLPPIDNLATFAYSPDGTKLASVSYEGTLVLWDLSTYQQIGEPLQLTGDLGIFMFSPDGTKLASVSYDPFTSEDWAILLWDVETHQQIGESFQYPGKDISNIGFSPDGRTLALGINALFTGTDGTSQYTGTIIFLDVETLQQTGEPLQVGRDMSIFAFSPDGRTLVSASNGRTQSDTSTITFWGVDTHRQIGESIQYAGAITSVAFSPDGEILASGTWGGNTILWDVETHQQIGEPLRGHTISVTSIAFSHDGTKLASSGNEGTIILWDIETHQQIGGPIPGGVYAVEQVVFSPDSTKLGSSSDGTIILWNLETQAWREKSCQRAGRNFSRGEWEQYFPNEKYHQTCDQWPLEPELIVQPSPTP